MKSMAFGHILLTRFSYRANTEVNSRESGDDSWDRLDPLEPNRLDFRFVLFECVCLPNVLEQTNQDFDWVLIIDPDLPMKYRQRLEKLTAKRKRTYLHEFSPHDNLITLDWLDKYMSNDVDFVLTTNLDDDDIITLDYVDKLQSHVRGLGENCPSVKFIGIKKTYQWDLFTSTKHSLGTWAPWHRVNWYRSTGLSLLCRSSVHQLTCLAIHHGYADVWYLQGSVEQQAQIALKTWELSPNESNKSHYFVPEIISSFQRELDKSSAAGADDWKSLPSTELHYDLSKEGIIAVHLNHFMNDQTDRLFEYKPESTTVVDKEFFPNDVKIDWNVFNEHHKLFELSPKLYKNYVAEIYSYVKRVKLNWWRTLLIIVTLRTKLKWWFLRN